MTAANRKCFSTNTVAEETKASCKFQLNLFLYKCVCYRESDKDDVDDVDDEPNISADCSS